MEIRITLPREAGAIVRTFFKDFCETNGFDDLPAWPENFTASKVWADAVHEQRSPFYRLRAKVHQAFTPSELRVRILPKDADEFLDDTQLEAYFISITHVYGGDWKITIRPEAKEIRLEEKVLKALYQLAL